MDPGYPDPRKEEGERGSGFVDEEDRESERGRKEFGLTTIADKGDRERERERERKGVRPRHHRW